MANDRQKESNWRHISYYGDTPCHECTEREAGCHGSCARYQEWQRNSEAMRSRIRMEKEADKYRKEVSTRMRAWRWLNERRGGR